MEQLMAIGNKDHNPFRSVLQRLAYFIESNKVTVSNLLARLSDDDVSIEKFAEFLKQKVDKRADLAKL
jgi:pyruvate-formate lyase-activating enzyme